MCIFNAITLINLIDAFEAETSTISGGERSKRGSRWHWPDFCQVATIAASNLCKWGFRGSIAEARLDRADEPKSGLGSMERIANPSLFFFRATQPFLTTIKYIKSVAAESVVQN